jgi:D-xylose transport system permease protein
MSTDTVETRESSDQQVTVGSLVSDYGKRLRGGDVGSLPAILGLVVLVILFSVLRPSTFTTELNFANLISQEAGVTVLAMGLVFVLLLGEIDLSAGFTGGTAAAVLGVVLTRHGWPLVPSLIACLATGAAIGWLLGTLVARLGIPSFVVTLAAFLGLQGILLLIIGEGGTIGFSNSFILALNNDNMPIWLGWLLAVTGIAAYAVGGLVANLQQRRSGLSYEPLIKWAVKSALVAVIALGVVGWLSGERSVNPKLHSLKGVPVVMAIIVGLMLVLNFMLTRTSWGLHVYAVGGNAEAARRAGINVAWIRLSCFMVSSTVAAIAGILIASRDNSVSPTTGGSQTLLYAVGAAVIGGTSLFGGKGRVVDALIGGTVIAVIDNGMLLLNQSSGVVFLVTGIVLLFAASVDAISRRRANATGRI